MTTNTATSPTLERRTDFGGAAAGLRLSHLVMQYGDVQAVRDVSLDVAPGEFLTLLGPSGSGKSTTLAMVAGFETPTSGSIMLGDQDITRLVTHKRNLGMMFQGYALFPHMSVFDNVAFPLKLRKTPKAEIRRRVMESLEIVDLAAFGERRPSALSGGQQQRVALARAIVHRPGILLMDEPLSALDKALRSQMQVELRKIHAELGCTVLFVTHDQEEALSLSDRIVVMNQGEIAQVGDPTEIYERPATEFVARFIGSAHFLAATMDEPGTAIANGRRLTGRNTGAVAKGAAVRVVLRPEDATFERPAEPANELKVQILAQVYLGERIRCEARFEDGSDGMLWLSHADLDKVRVGDEVTVFWPCARTTFVPKG
jgi:putative spermidine/putrescine transport system ATP-binding protein